MKDLWNEARIYGTVDLFTADDGTYSCCISFRTIKHVELKARSGYNCITPEEAIASSIKKAKEIVESISQTAQDLKKLTNAH